MQEREATEQPNETETITRIDFEEPGFITITITPPGSKQTINLEETFSRLSFDAYNAEAVRQWELTFVRLAQLCNSARRDLQRSGRI